MYFSVFSSSEYYSDEDVTNDIIFDETDICIICWMPEEKNNRLKNLSDFSHIITTCKCHPQIHTLCLNNWINKNKSCPICRTKLTINIFKTNDNIIVNFYVNFIGCAVRTLKILSYASFVNLMCLLVYNVYNIYFMTNKYYEDDYGIY